MKNTILLGSAFAAMLLLMPAVSAIQDSYMYVSLSYGRGWWPWVCVTEKGEKGVCGVDKNSSFSYSGTYENYMRTYGCATNFCRARGCPFEWATMTGLSCHDLSGEEYSKCDQYIQEDIKYGECIKEVAASLGDYWAEISPPAWGLVVKITIPEDVKVVNSEGTVVSDSVCLGDTLHVIKGVNKGEWWNDGGHEDSPPIYWVDDVVNLTKELMRYHDSHVTTHEEVYNQKKPEEGWVDPLVNAPVYTYPVTLHYGYGGGTAYLTGNLLCSFINRSSGIFDEEDNYKVDDTHGETLDLFYLYDVLCMFYYHGGSVSYSSGEYLTLRVPTVIQAGPHATYEDWGTHNVKYGWEPDFFKVGEARLQKTVSVVRPVSPELEITVPGAESLDLKEANFVRVLVKNKGDVDVDLLDVSSNAAYKFISCDAKTVKPGETTECLIEVSPQVGEGVSVSVNYGYKTCGKSMKGVASKEVLSSQVVKASSMSQVYALDVSGDCVNRYYVCNSALEQQWFSLGYKCSTKEANNYLVSSLERIDLSFGLPVLPEGATVAGARLGLTASGASKAQDVSVYSVSGWSQAFCVPGGDICAKPSCEECAPLFDLSGQKLGTTNIPGPGKYYIDVTDAVKQAYQNKNAKVFLQLRGKEDYGADTDSCGAGKDWIRYDLNFRGKADAPYLEIVYAK